MGTAPTRRPPLAANVRCCGAQPVRAVVEPLSSSAFRKTWLTVGLMSPAQASQASGATSPIALWTERVMVSPPSFIAGARSADLEGGFDLDRDAAGQAVHPDRGARMTAEIAEHRDHQIRGAVDHLGHVGELPGAVDKPADPQTSAHAVEIAAAGDAQMGEDVERAELCRLTAVGDADPGAELALKAELAVPLADLAGDEDEIAGD